MTKYLHHLSNSIELAKITSAEQQMTPKLPLGLPFDIEPVHRQFIVYLPPPDSLLEVENARDSKTLHLRHIQSISHQGAGYYSVQTTPWTTTDQVAHELRELMLVL